MTGLSHCVTLRVDVPADTAFRFLTDPLQLGRWSLGCFDTTAAVAPGLFTGVSLYDGSRGWFRIEADFGTPHRGLSRRRRDVAGAACFRTRDSRTGV